MFNVLLNLLLLSYFLLGIIINLIKCEEIIIIKEEEKSDHKSYQPVNNENSLQSVKSLKTHETQQVFNRLLNSFIQKYKRHQVDSSAAQINNSSLKSTQVDFNQPVNMITTNESDNDTDDSDDIVDDLLHGNSLQEINYFHDSPQYVNKTVCKSQYTWREITIPWRVLMKNFNSNCTHLLGNLIISGLDQDDDITFLENIEEISGYLVIYGVGRKELRLPRLKLIKGLDYVSFKSRKVSLLVVSNYMKSTEQNEVFNEFSSPSDMLSSTTTTATHSDDTLKAKNSGLRHLQSLEMTSLISIVQHGIYFYDNPGLCYTPFTLKWDEMIESSELQTIDLLAIHSDANIFLWYEYCQCKYLNLCTNTRNNNDKTTTKSSLFNVSIQVEQLTNELSQQIDNDLKKRSNIKKKRDVMNIIEQVKDGVSGSLQDTLNLSISSTELQRNHSVSQMTPLKDDIILSEDEEKRIASIDHSENEDSYTTTLLADDNMKEITQLTNMFEGNKLVAKIGRELDDLYDESSNSISEQFHDETTETTLEISSEDHSINNEASTTTNLDETVSTVETTGNESIEYNTLLINQTSTLQYPDHENTTDSSIMTTASNEPMTTDNSSPNTYNPKNEKESAIAYPTERPNLPCHPVCPAIQGKRYCWGPGPDQCQAVHKCQVRLCEGSNWCFRKRSYTFEKDISIHHSRQLHTSVNYGYSKEHCCHSECAAGCHGPRARDCNACLRLSNRGVCTDSCPASRIYNKSTFSWRENPDGLLTFGSICVKSCPKTYLRDGDHCVSKCARPGYFAYRGQCIPCPNSICPKVCTLKEIESIKGVDYLHRRSLRAMENCTIFEGDIKLSMQSFIGDPFYNLSQIDEGVQWEDLVIGLSKLEQITGILYISAGFHAPWMTNLTFLSNVKIIGGISPNIQQTRTININLNHHLEFLGMTSLRRLGHPSVLITGNPRLCYVDTIDWTTLFTDELITHSNENKQILLPKMSKIDFIENGLLSQTTTLLSSTERRVLRRRRPIKESAVFIGGNAHFEFCRGRGAMCDEVCQPHAGCWGPGTKFCYYCKYWSVESPKGGQLCVQKCEDVPGFYTPIINNSEIDSKEMLTTGLNKLTLLQYNTTNNLTTNETTNPLEISSTYPTAGNSQPKEIQVLSHTFPPMQCQKCSSMCSLQKNTCNGPNEDQCIGSCRFVKDGPFCRANCPPNKYADPLTKKCLDCSTACTPPVDMGEDSTISNIKLFDQKIGLLLQPYCIGNGDWPGVGGCYFCKRTVLYLEPKNSNHHLKCVNSCPFGTYLHVINLHHRGGSSVHRSSSFYFSMKDQDLLKSIKSDLFTRSPWSQTDASLFHNLPSKVTQEIADWLSNHTQPKLYGLAQICLPCNEQCHSEITAARQSSEGSPSTSVACYGPSPEQCVRCVNASYQGRCVSACPTGTYPKKKSFRNLDSSATNYSYQYQRQENQMRSSMDWTECLLCHKECETGCTGPTPTECTHCRHVKIYLDSEKKSWLCNNTCPTFSPFKIPETRSGEIVCSSDSNMIHIIPYNVSNFGKEYQIITENVSIVVNNLNRTKDLDMISDLLLNNQYLSSETVGLLSALSALFIMLILFSFIICWTVHTRSKYIKIDLKSEYGDEFNNDVDKTDSHLLPLSCSKICKDIWTQGKPQPMIKKTKKKTEKLKVDQSVSRKVSTEKYKCLKDKLLNSLEWSGSQTPASDTTSPDKEEKRTNFSSEETSPTHSNSFKPNMATLRIITESELIRGPLIGSGAFGTVYCGVWCPKLIKTKIDTLNNTLCSTLTNATTTTTTTTTNTTAATTPCALNPMKFDWDKQTNDIESITTSIEENYFNLNIPVAIKVLSDSADPQTNKELLEEAKVMATVDHPCCVRFLALCLTSKLQLITQFLPLGSLLEFVKTQWDTVEVSSLFQWSEQIASGMAYLSTRGIIHRDLAARNVLVQSKGQVQITDFGLAKCLDTTNSEYHASGGRMPIKWLAIECIQDRIFSSKSDVWAYGITLWEMCTFGQRPYENIHAKDLLDFLEKGNRLPQPETTSLDFYCLMLQCWDVDPNFRPTFKEICTVLCEMKTTPSRYLFIVPELRLHNSATSQQTSSSQSAFEFLSDCLTDTTIPPLPPPKQSIPNHNYEQANQIVGQNSDFIDYIEYTQMHYDWLKNLYVNSKTNLFPECVKTLLDNYNNYLIGININDSSNTNGNSKYEDNYIRFQNQVFSKYRNKSIHENIETNENTCSNKEYADVHRNSLSRQKEHTNIKDNKESLEYLEVKPESFERNPTLFNVKRGISIFDKDQVQDSDNR